MLAHSTVLAPFSNLAQHLSNNVGQRSLLLPISGTWQGFYVISAHVHLHRPMKPKDPRLRRLYMLVHDEALLRLGSETSMLAYPKVLSAVITCKLLQAHLLEPLTTTTFRQLPRIQNNAKTSTVSVIGSTQGSQLAFDNMHPLTLQVWGHINNPAR